MTLRFSGFSPFSSVLGAALLAGGHNQERK